MLTQIQFSHHFIPSLSALNPLVELCAGCNEEKLKIQLKSYIIFEVSARTIYIYFEQIAGEELKCK